MKRFIEAAEYEHPQNIFLTPSAGDILSHVDDSHLVWSDLADSNPAFLEQVANHEKHIEILNDVLQVLPSPNTEIEDAVEQGLLSAAKAEALYNDLSELLRDEDYQRLVLYLPFQFIPAIDWTPANNDLSAAIDAFTTHYVQAWQNQLSVQDVRANFVDGDVLEVDQRNGDLPRVVKAAHLIPGLVSKGILNLESVRAFFDTVSEPILKGSIAESLAVIENSNQSELQTKEHTEPDNPTEGRKKWLQEKNDRMYITEIAEQATEMILVAANNLPGLSVDAAPISQRVYIESVRRAIEKAAMNGAVDPAAIYAYFGPELLNLWQSAENPDVQDSLTKTFRHAYRLGVINQPQLNELGIASTQLSSPFTENLKLIPEEMQKLHEITTSIENDEELRELIYPVLSIGGSRLKGYGGEASDLDTGIFIRPTTTAADYPKLRLLLDSHFSVNSLENDSIEFWLQEDGNMLQVRTDAESTAVVANEMWTHILLGSPLIGNPEAAQELHQRLLPTYFLEDASKIHGRTKRALYLERLEQDLLQYRLLHKGYERHFPRITDTNNPRYKPIDGDSMFWDAGYRQLATRLFIEKVFLPKLH